MNCPTCGCCAKENMANFKKFYYCSECKEEVVPKPFGSQELEGDDFDVNNLTPEEEGEIAAWFDDAYGDTELASWFEGDSGDTEFDGCD